MRSSLRQSLHSLLSARFWRSIIAPGAACLMYHRVQPANEIDTIYPPLRGLSVSDVQFELQMRFVAENCHPISLGEAVDRVRSGHLSSRDVVVTFDDGYLDNLTCALPVLEKYGVPATVYVTVAGPSGQAYAWWYELGALLNGAPEGNLQLGNRRFAWKTPEERDACFFDINELLKSTSPELLASFMISARSLSDGDFRFPAPSLSWEDVRTLHEHPLVTIGAHTLSHHSMRALPEDQLIADFQESKAILEEQIGDKVAHLAYPYGKQAEASEREFGAAALVGYESAVTTRYGHWRTDHKHHLHSLPRLTITSHDQPVSFAQKLNGVRDLIQNRGRRLITD